MVDRLKGQQEIYILLFMIHSFNICIMYMYLQSESSSDQRRYWREDKVFAEGNDSTASGYVGQMKYMLSPRRAVKSFKHCRSVYFIATDICNNHVVYSHNLAIH